MGDPDSKTATMSETSSLTDRQERERAYYDEYVELRGPQHVSFAPVEGRERRPWNPYWYIHELVAQWAGPGRRLLDYGCGPGLTSVLLARQGFDVNGFDISPRNIERANALAARYDLSDRTDFSVETAERLSYPDSMFDVVVGLDILHHVEIGPAIRECLRVLKPGGTAVFHEPVEAVLFERLRNSRLGRWLVPKTASFDRHITEDERKLTADDLHAIREIAPDLTLRPFLLFARLDHVVPYRGRLKWSPLERFDAALLRSVPGLGRFAGKVVMTFQKPGVA